MRARRRWLWPLVVIAIGVLVWWAERGSSSRATGPRVEPLRGSGVDGPAGEMRPAPTPAPTPEKPSPPR